MKQLKSIALVLLLVFLGGAGSESTLKFIAPDAVDILGLLPAPPAPGSQEDKIDLQAVLDEQAVRTPAETQLAIADAKMSAFSFSGVIGEWFTAQSCPKTDALFREIEADSKYFSRKAKDHWDRPRPPFADARVKSVLEAEHEGSYPSGHAVRGILFATVLAEAFPEQKEPLLRRGQEIGWERVVAGVHYPSDVIAGRVLGQALARAMLHDDRLQQRLTEVKLEIEQVRRQHADVQHPQASSR